MSYRDVLTARLREKNLAALAFEGGMAADEAEKVAGYAMYRAMKVLGEELAKDLSWNVLDELNAQAEIPEMSGAYLEWSGENDDEVLTLRMNCERCHSTPPQVITNVDLYIDTLARWFPEVFADLV